MTMSLKRFVMQLKSCWMKIFNTALLRLLGKEVDDVAVVYATLIIKGRKTFADVPDTLKAQVRQILIDLGVPELAE